MTTMMTAKVLFPISKLAGVMHVGTVTVPAACGTEALASDGFWKQVRKAMRKERLTGTRKVRIVCDGAVVERTLMIEQWEEV